MKNLLLVFTCFAISLNSFAQGKDELLSLVNELREKGGNNLVFAEVREIPDKTKDDLYYLVRSFFAESFRSANDVIQHDDPNNSTVGGRGAFSHSFIYSKLMGMSCTIYYNYYLKVQCKDGRYRAEISSIDHMSATEYSTGRIPLTLYETDEEYKKMGKMVANFTYESLRPVSENVNSILSGLYAYMSGVKTPSSSDW